jgi:hypothetical protein
MLLKKVAFADNREKIISAKSQFPGFSALLAVGAKNDSVRAEKRGRDTGQGHGAGTR